LFHDTPTVQSAAALALAAGSEAAALGASLAAALGAVLDPPPPLQAAKMKAAVAVTAANRRMDIVDSPPLGAVPSSDRCRPPRLPL
jgi:hypothetical protein